jgi:lysozyme family protein
MAALGHRAPRLWRAAANVQVLGAGVPDQLGLKITADLADLHLEAQPTLDLVKATWTATMMLRHPGAPRLAEALGVPSAAAWLGDGSLSVIAQLSGAPARLAADGFELSAGSLHATGALLLERDRLQPLLTGHIAAETLPLPLPYPRALDPLPIEALAGWEASVKLDAGHVLAGLLPVMEQATATVALAKGVLRIDALAGKVGGGTLSGLAILDSQAQPPSLAADLTIAGAAVGAPLFDLPLDIASGTLDLGVALSASGHSPAALLSTLSGQIQMQVRDGVLSGVAMAKATDGLTPEDVQAALRGGATPFDALEARAQADKGVLTLRHATLTAPSGSASLTGTIDLPESAGDLRLALRPAVPDSPEIGLRLTGPLDALRRSAELAEVTRWRTARAAPAAGPEPTASP